MALQPRTAVVCLATPTHDTIHTFAQLQASGRVTAACNLQKDVHGGLTGTLTQLPADAPLSALLGLTSNLFAGVSLVECEDDFANWEGDLEAQVAAFAAQVTARGGGTQPGLADLVPLGRANDFYFEGQRAVFRGSAADIDAMQAEAERGDVVFHDMYTVDDGTGGTFADRSLTDDAPWQARLCGELGIVRGATGSFLVCRGGAPELAAELVDAVRGDLPGDVTCGTFATSKEVWFLEHFARRNRLRLLAQLAAALGVSVMQEHDSLAHTDTVPTERMLAVETYGSTQEELREHNGVVELAKGCTRVTPWSGPIPVWLGGWQGVLLWSVPWHATHGADDILVPTLNLYRPPNVQDTSGSRVNADDVRVLVQYGQVQLSPGQEHILGQRDASGNACMSAVLYPHPLPLVLCPVDAPEFCPPTLQTLQALQAPQESPDLPPNTDADAVMASLNEGLRAIHMDSEVALQPPAPMGHVPEGVHFDRLALAGLATATGSQHTDIHHVLLRPLTALAAEAGI
tara:strand:+ start:131 stop:1678 length:1548 start_codon:yes stop_codon:yes gene_type:complete